MLEIKNERLKLSEIKNNIKKLQVQELFSSSVMPDGSEEELIAILSRLSELGYDKLTELLSTYSDFVKGNKEKLIAFTIQYSIPDNVDLLVKLLESKLDRKNFSPRAQYYEGLLKTIDQNLAQKDAQMIEYVNVITDHALTICNNPNDCDSEVISGDKVSVIPTNVFNPLVHKMAKHMPRDMADKLKIFNDIENEIAVTELILEDGQELGSLNGNDSIAIRSAYDNLEKTRALLIKKSRIIERDVVKFTVDKIALLVQDQKDLFLQDHKDRLDAIISPISLEEKQRLDQKLKDETNELFETLNELNKKLRDSADFSRDLIVTDLLKIERLILQLELKKFTGKRKFDFSEISSDLKKLNKYYKNVPSNRLAGIERDAKSKKYTSETDVISSLIGYSKFIVQVINFFRTIFQGFKVIFSAITDGFNQMFGLLFRTFARMSSNNQKLLKMIDQLIDDVQKSDCEKKLKAKLLEDIDILRSKVGRLTAKTSSILDEFESLKSRFLTRDTTKTEVGVEENTTNMTFIESDSDGETVISVILDSSSSESPTYPTAFEHAELIARLMEQTPADAAIIAKDACHQFTVPKAKELINHKIEAIFLDVNTKLTDLQHQLTDQLVVERRDQAKIEVLAAQIRTLEITKFELSNIAREFDSLKDKLPGDDTVQGLDKVELSLKKVEHHLRLYESTATAIERMYHALSAFLEDESHEKAATKALLKNVLKEVSEQSKDPTSTASSIARSALLAALDKAPSVVQAMTSKLGVAHEMRACKHIIDSTFNAAIDALKNQKDIQGIRGACQNAVAQSLIEETARLGVVLVGTEPPSDAEADKQFKKKIKKLSQSMSTLSLEIFAANQGFHMLLLMVDRHPNLRPLLEQTLNRVRDVATEALKDGKTYEEIVSAAKIAMIQKIKSVLKDAPVTHKPKTIIHEELEDLGSRIKSSIHQLDIEMVALQEQEEKLTTQTAPDEPNKELLRGQLIKIQLQIKEKIESIKKIKQIQDKFDAVLADELALNRIAEAYQEGAERYQLIYRVEQYEPIQNRKIELEQELDDIVSPGLLAQVHSFIEQFYATSSLPTQKAISAVFRDVVIAVSDSVEKGDLATDTAIKGLDVALQGWVDVMKMLSFASGERGKAIEDLIKTSIEAAVKTNHDDPRATVDLNFLARQAVIKALEEIQKDDFLNKITINFCQGTQKELVLIGAKAAINKLKEEKSTLSEAKDIFLLAVSQHVHSVWAPNPLQIAVRILLPQAAPLVPPQKSTDTTETPTAIISDQQSMISQVSNYLGSFFNKPKASPPSKIDPISNPATGPGVPQ